MTMSNVEPYVGPRPFQRVDEAFFFGREKEASDLLSLIIATPLLLLYSRSGAGKTSLINARLVPMLEQEGIVTLPIARVQGRIPKEINLGATPGANIYVFNALASWKKKDDNPLALMTMTLAEFLSRESKPVGEEEQAAPRVIVFDQFEELFTFYPGRWADRLEFFRQVSDLLEGSPVLLRASDLQKPADLIEDFATGRSALSGELVKLLSPEAQRLIGNGNGVAGTPDAIKMLVDDLNRIIQGDSLFVERAFAGAELRSETKELIRRQPVGREALRLNRLLIEDAYPRYIRRRTEGDPLLRVLFSMREDFIAELDPYASVLPNKLRSRYRLEPLRERAALSAVKGPLEKTDLRFAPGVAEHLVENLLKIEMKTAEGVTEIPGEFVEPVQLQVVCQSLWEKVRTAGEKEITEDHLRKHGNVGKALRAFYEKTIQNVVKSKEVKEGGLRRWFEEVLITTAGTRGMVFRGLTTTAGLSNDVVDLLESQHMIRAELRGGERWYELSHDRFIQPIRESNNDWRLVRSGAVTKRNELEAQAASWVREGRGDVGLLDESAAVEAKRWIESPEAVEVGYSQDLFAFVQSSRLAISKANSERDRAILERENEQAKALAEEQRLRAEEQAQSKQKWRKMVVGLAIMFLLAIGMTIFASTQWSQARHSAAQAQAEAKRANDAASRNENLRIQAIAKEQDAREAKDESERARDEAQKSAEEATRQAALARRNEQVARAASEEANKQRDIAEARAEELAKAREDLREEARKANEARENAINLANVANAEREKAEKALREAEKQTQIATDRFNELKEVKTVDSLKEEGARLERYNDFRGALEKYQAALQIYAKYEDKASQSSLLETIARVQNQLGQEDNSIKSYNDALSYIDPADKASRARILTSIGNSAEYTKALEYHQEALKIYEELSDNKGRFINLIQIAGIKDKLNDPKGAEDALKGALDAAVKMNSKAHIGAVYSVYANIYSRQERYKDAIEYNLKALEISQIEKDTSAQQKLLYELVDLYNRIGKKAEADNYYRKAQGLQNKVKK